MLTTTYAPASCQYSNSGYVRKLSAWEGPRCSPVARRLFHFASNRRHAGLRCPQASAQVLPRHASRQLPNIAIARHLRGLPSRDGLRSQSSGEHASGRRSIAPTGVVPADSLPGELLVQATDTALVTSTLVLGCLFSMLGVQPQGQQPRRKPVNDLPAVAGAASHGCQLLALPPTATAGIAFGESVAGVGNAAGGDNYFDNSSSGIRCNIGGDGDGGSGGGGSGGGDGDGGRSEMGGQRVLTSSLQSAGAPGQVQPTNLEGADSNEYSSSGGGLDRFNDGGGGGKNVYGDEGRRRGGYAAGDGDKGRGGYNDSGGGRGAGGGGRGGYGGGAWRGSDAGEAGDGHGTLGLGMVFGLCLSLVAAITLLARRTKLLPARPQDLTFHHRYLPQLHSLFPLQELKQLPLSSGVAEEQEPQRPRAQQGQDQQQAQQQQQQQQQPLGTAQGTAVQPEDPECFARDILLAGAAAGAAAAAAGSAIRIRCRNFRSSGSTRSHGIGVSMAAMMATAAEASSPWPVMSPFEPVARGGLAGAGSQVKPKQATVVLHTLLQQQDAWRPVGACELYASCHAGDYNDSRSGQQSLHLPASQRGKHPRVKQQGVRAGRRGCNAGSGSSQGGSQGSSSRSCSPLRYEAEVPKSARGGVVDGRQTAPALGAALQTRRRGRKRVAVGPTRSGTSPASPRPLPAVEAVPKPTPIPAAPAPAPLVADTAAAAPRRMASAVAAAAAVPSLRGADVGRTLTPGPAARYSPGGDAGALAAVSFCDEIAALGAVRTGLEGAHRRADMWLAAGTLGSTSAGAVAVAPV